MQDTAPEIIETATTPPHPQAKWWRASDMLVVLTAVAGVALAVACSGPSASAASADDVVRKGHLLYQKQCATCHGTSGDRIPVAPLTSKDFLASRGDATLLAVVAEGKGVMPAFSVARGGPFSEPDIRAVVAYLNQRAGRESTGVLAEVGQQLFVTTCVGCHGPKGDRIPIAPLNAKGFLNAKTDVELKDVIAQGKGMMPPFAMSAGGKLSDVDLDAIVAALRYRVEEQTALTARRGRDLYVANCLQCHGTEGNRIPGVELASARFLQSVGDGGILIALAEGKGIMPAFGTSSGGSMGVPDIASLLIYMKTWAGLNATSAMASTGMVGQGRDLFTRNCTACHGAGGDRVPGVKLLSKEFLERETDGVLLQTITKGNAKGMPAWGVEAGGPLTQAQIQSIVGFLKSSAVAASGSAQASTSAPTSSDVVISITQDTVKRGREIFMGTCAACHGETRDKVPTCRLAEADFLKQRGDATLVESITLGKGPMPAWGLVKGGPLSPDDVKVVLAFLKNAAGMGTFQEAPAPPPSTPAPSVSSPALSSELVAKGKDLFKSTCAMCHGETRDKVPTCQLANKEWLQNKGFDGVVKDATEGKPPMMPAWGKDKGGPLSAEQIKAIVTYLWDAVGLTAEGGPAQGAATPESKTSAPPPTPTETSASPLVPSAKVGKDIFMGTCAMCHGQDGFAQRNCPLGSREWISNMSLEGLMARIRRGKPAAGMPTWGASLGGPLSEAQIMAVAMYLGEAAR